MLQEANTNYKAIPPTELIITEEGRIYHLDLKPDEIGHTIILVGDQERVPTISKYFDRIEFKRSKREFVTHTGLINNKRVSVISTGIGCDNIDIVINELDALVNIDFYKKKYKKKTYLLRYNKNRNMWCFTKRNPSRHFCFIYFWTRF
jgi:uridine phosphorylase